MSLITIYVIFALTTALSALYELFWPVIRDVRTLEPETMVARNWKMATFSLFVGALILAPLMIPSVIVPGFGEKFRNKLYHNLIVEQKS